MCYIKYEHPAGGTVVRSSRTTSSVRYSRRFLRKRGTTILTTLYMNCTATFRKTWRETLMPSACFCKSGHLRANQHAWCNVFLSLYNVVQSMYNGTSVFVRVISGYFRGTKPGSRWVGQPQQPSRIRVALSPIVRTKIDRTADSKGAVAVFQYLGKQSSSLDLMAANLPMYFLVRIIRGRGSFEFLQGVQAHQWPESRFWFARNQDGQNCHCFTTCRTVSCPAHRW